MAFLVIGSVLTVLGIIATITGTVLQSKETNEYRIRSLKPMLNIIDYSFNYNKFDNPYFTVKLINSGNENCTSLAVLIEDINLPLFKKRVIERYSTLPNGTEMNFRIYPFDKNIEEKSTNEVAIQEYKKCINRFHEGNLGVIVKFCIHYEWNENFYRTDTYKIIKVKNAQFVFFSNEGGARVFKEDELDEKTGFPQSQFN